MKVLELIAHCMGADKKNMDLTDRTECYKNLSCKVKNMEHI